MSGVGLVGAGRIAEFHVAALRELGIPLVGLVTSTPERSSAAAHRLGAERSFDDLDSMLRDPRIDAIHITTPTAFHAEQVERALAAGKHVVCEKPLSTTSAHSARLAQLAHGSGLVGAVAYAYRYHHASRTAKARRSALGSALLVQASYLQHWALDADPGDWRLEADCVGSSRALADIGCHAIDLLEFVTGERIRAVSTFPGQTAPPESRSSRAMNDSAVVAFELSSGAIGSLVVSQVAVGHDNALHLRVQGTLGSVSVGIGDVSEFRAVFRGGIEPPALAGTGPAETGAAAYVGAYVDFLRAFRQAMSGAWPQNLPSFDDCARTHRVRDAILRSASTGTREEVCLATADTSIVREDDRQRLGSMAWVEGVTR